jgi:DNA-directed RNA polymerase subunit L
MAKKSRVRRRKSIKRKSRVRRGRKIIKGGADGRFFAFVSDKTLEESGFVKDERAIIYNKSEVVKDIYKTPAIIEAEGKIGQAEELGEKLLEVEVKDEDKFNIKIDGDRITYNKSFGNVLTRGPRVKNGKYEITRISRMKEPEGLCIINYSDKAQREAAKKAEAEMLDMFEEPDE